MYKREGRDGSGNNNNGGGRVLFLCEICRFPFTTLNALIVHFRVAHQDSAEVIRNNVSSLTWGSQRKRSAVHVIYPCNRCNMEFQSPGDLERHGFACRRRHRSPSVDIQDPEPVPPSPVRRKTVLNHSPPAKRRRIDQNQSRSPRDTYGNESGHGQFRCDLCNKGFATAQALGGHRGHCRRISNLPQKSPAANSLVQHRCDLCYREFSRSQSLANHKKACIRINQRAQPSHTRTRQWPSSSANSTGQLCWEKACRRLHQLVQSSVNQDNVVLPQPSQAAAAPTLPPTSSNSSVLLQPQATDESQQEAQVVFNLDLNKLSSPEDSDDAP